MRLSAYDTFCLYLALKNHFSRWSYDYFKYNGKTSVTKDAFMIRKDRFQFQKLSRMYDESEIRDFLIANFLHDEKVWVGSLLEDEAKDRYHNYLKRKQSLSYTFENELNNLTNTVNDDIKALFKTENNGYLPVVSGYYQHRAGIETLALLDYFVGYFDKYDKIFHDDYLWSKLRMKCKKLLPFLTFDKEKIKNIIKEKANAHIYS